MASDDTECPAAPVDSATTDTSPSRTAPPDRPTVAAATRDGEVLGNDDAGDESLTPAEKRLLGGLALAGVVVLLIILAVNFFGGDDTTDEANPEATEVVSEAFGDGGGVVATPKALEPTGDPVADNLDRAELAGGPLDWSVLGAGTWAISDGAMVSSTASKDAQPMAVATVPDDLGDDWAFSISVDQPAQDAGLVWGVVDAENYWELRANQQYAAVVINRIEKGTVTQVKLLGPTGLVEGQRYTVQHLGDTITIAEGDTPFLSISDPSLAKPRKVGVIANTADEAAFTKPEVAKIDPKS